MLKDGFISFEEFVDFVFSTGDKDFLSDADLEKVRQLSTRGFKEEKREKEGQSRENSPQPLWSIWKQPGFYRFLTRRCAPRRPHQPPFSYSILVCRATKIASTATMQWGCHRPLLIRRARRAFSFRVAGSNCHGQHVQPVCSRKVRMMLANIALATPKQILKSQPVQIWWRSTFHYFCSIFFWVAICAYMCYILLGPISNSYSCVTRSWRCWQTAWRNCNCSCSGVMRCAEERMAADSGMGDGAYLGYPEIDG